MLNEMVDATSGTQFKHSDFEGILSNYSTYLKGELKDYMLIYMDDSDYNNFSIFFDYFQGHRNFNYKFFEEKHLEYIKYLRELGRKIPPFMETASEALQLLYDTNISLTNGNPYRTSEGVMMNIYATAFRSNQIAFGAGT